MKRETKKERREGERKKEMYTVADSGQAEKGMGKKEAVESEGER